MEREPVGEPAALVVFLLLGHNWGSRIDWLAMLLSSQPRRRMTAIAASALLSSFFLAGFDVGMPLWVTGELGFDAAAWARLRAWRMTGTLVGAVFLGAVSDRFGARLLAALNLAISAGLVLAMVGGDGARVLWLAMPFFGACISTVFMNTNSLTQQVSTHRQGLANSVYRGVGAVAGVVGPVVATVVASRVGGYRPVFAAGSGLLVLAGIALWFYPDEPVPAFRSVREEIRGLWRGYRHVLRQRELMRYLHLSCLWLGLLMGITAFPPIYFTQNLGGTDPAYGSLAGAAGLLGVGAVTAGAFILDRCRLPAVMGSIGLLAAAGTILMGSVTAMPVFAVGFLVCLPMLTLSLSPFSMWVSRGAGPGMVTAGFAVSKVLGAAYAAACLAGLGWLESLVGIRPVLLGSGSVGLVLGAMFFRLPDPAAHGGRSATNAADRHGTGGGRPAVP